MGINLSVRTKRSTNVKYIRGKLAEIADQFTWGLEKRLRKVWEKERVVPFVPCCTLFRTTFIHSERYHCAFERIFSLHNCPEKARLFEDFKAL